MAFSLSLTPSAFPQGTDPTVVECFRKADRDGNGLIDDRELQEVLSSKNQSFSIRTVHLLMYLFTNNNTREIGPENFVDVFRNLQKCKALFNQSDRDRNGQISEGELRQALHGSLGFSVSPKVVKLLVSKFGGKTKAIKYDGFIECFLAVKGLTEKFKEHDTEDTGEATFDYESFMLTVLPFLTGF